MRMPPRTNRTQDRTERTSVPTETVEEHGGYLEGALAAAERAVTSVAHTS